jgi:beta-phosphoglucomutase-like phosphatase (HAD superfamily)
VTGEDTTRHKPDPAPYIEARSRLAVAPAEALVIEDSPNGVRSARAAGAYVVAMTAGFPAFELSVAGAHEIVAGFDELSRDLHDTPA